MSEAAPPDDADPLAEAGARLERAVSAVAARMDGLSRRAGDAGAESAAARSADEDRARLAAALDEARGREHELAGAARDASAALVQAEQALQALLDAKPAPEDPAVDDAEDEA
ncbi:DUF4164 family protein [Alkalicaulis satelles]|uniref:DUF4164 family protein n=1 Tax=Alkalicaulis satelles TaxID=2609175 RepID=A0A5M6ZP09_9PROT|nr:DUF4164 family protein [Alkalicaulis satelles]KAA5803951.1 DUF4164 family protein [Alkalicaulis satelles]